MLETLKSELPRGVIRYSSKVVHVESNDRVISVHLADGTVLKTKVKLLASSIKLPFLNCNKAKFDNHLCNH